MTGVSDPGALISLEGRTALVAGGGGGIGRAVCALLARAGARVISADLPGRSGPAGSESRSCDLTRPEAVHALLAELDALHIVAHCVGMTADATLWKMSDEQWRRVLSVNLDSAFYLMRGAAPLLRAAGGGAVVLVSSINGERGKRGQANYAASKAGLIALGRTAALELGRFGVRVNVIAPGWVDTEMTAGLPPEVRERARSESVLGRLGQPEDVAAAALFLCSDLSRHVTGQVLRVDGGQLTA
jgi:3-oxoacyl-[acyl-carrier protein] reductase